VDSVDFDALERQARALMPPASFAFCAAGADDEISARENITAWRAMRLRPRTAKHKMFACAQCAQCVEACGTVQQGQGRVSLLQWVDKDAARRNEAQVSLTGNRD